MRCNLHQKMEKKLSVLCFSHHHVLFSFSCAVECEAGRFGADCQQQCECENGGQCDRLTGRCSCAAGWIGERCERGEEPQ